MSMAIERLLMPAWLAMALRILAPRRSVASRAGLAPNDEVIEPRTEPKISATAGLRNENKNMLDAHLRAL
jgi:hypothetical protein